MDKILEEKNAVIVFRAFTALVVREIKRFSRYWLQTLVSPILTTLLYFIVFGKFLGGSFQNIEGVPYIKFIAPGLIMMAIIYNAYLNVASSLYGAKFQKYLEEILVSPLPESMIVLAFIVGGIARGLCLAVLFLLCAMLIVHIQISSAMLSGLVILLISCLFSLLGFINGLVAKRYEEVNFVLVFIITPLSFLGGVFYSTSMLPADLAWINYVNPIFYLVNLFRYAVIGVQDAPVSYSLYIVVLLIMVLFLLAVTLVKKGVGVKS